MQDYNTIIGSIQMRLNGCQTRSVMDRYKIGSGTLNLIMSRYHANGIPIEELRMMAPKEVEDLFYPQKNLQRKDVPLPDFQYYYDRIHAPGSRMNISFCWLDYKEKNPDGYEKSQFYEYFNRFIAENYGGQKVSMAVNRIPGEKMYIDWVGDQPELLTDTETGEIKKVHIFATTIGVSSLIYAEAFPNEKLPCFIEGCAHAVSFYGAVAKYFVPDNLKTAVTRHTKDELILQSTFADLEDFYETIVLPPPARKPKGYRQKNIISNLILNKRYNRMFRMNCCLLIADNYLIQPAEMEQIFFFSFPFLLRIRYNIAVRVLYRQCFLIYRAKSGSHGLIVCMGVD